MFTEQDFTDLAAHLNAVKQFVMGDENTTFTLPDGSQAKSLRKMVHDGLSDFLSSSGNQTITGNLGVHDLELFNPGGTAGKRRAAIRKKDNGIVFDILDDAGNSVGQPLFITADGILAYVGKNKALTKQTVSHAGAVVGCGVTPEIKGGYGIKAPAYLNNGMYEVFLDAPIADYEKAAVLITSNAAYNGVMFRCEGGLVNESRIVFGVQDNGNSPSDHPISVSINVFDYS